MGINIAIDGPAGAGKSTIAKKVAKELSFIYVDTGAMYRAMAFYLLEKGISGDENISKACHDADISIRYENGEQQVILNGKNVTAFLRKEEVGNMASVSSANPEVRAHLLKLQRNLAAENNVVMDGRDIGTTILPNAEVMIHQPLGGAQGQATEIKIHADHLVRTREKLNKFLSERTGKPLDVIEKDTERDNYMTAEEALEYGLIDGIMTKRA